MSSDPYADAARLRAQISDAVLAIGAVLADTEALARPSAVDELRQALDDLADAAAQFVDLLDWIDESDLPPGLRAALARPGAHEISIDPATGKVTRGPTPLEAGEPLPALVHTADMGEAYDTARLDLADLGVSDDPGNPHRRYRYRLRAIRDPMDIDGPHEHASLYLDDSGARRLAAMLRRRS